MRSVWMFDIEYLLRRAKGVVRRSAWMFDIEYLVAPAPVLGDGGVISWGEPDPGYAALMRSLMRGGAFIVASTDLVSKDKAQGLHGWLDKHHIPAGLTIVSSNTDSRDHVDRANEWLRENLYPSAKVLGAFSYGSGSADHLQVM